MALKKKNTVTGTKKRFKTAVNIEGTLRDHILLPVRGQNGVYIALREAINNSLDAKASKVRIKFDLYEGQPAIIISDNGSGMNHAGITSAMSYAFSSRRRDDLSTIGTNGTGMKSLLALNYKIEKTKITAATVHKVGECTKMEITFEYIVNLTKKKAKGDDYISSIPLPTDWQADMDRTTGTTVFVTGFDGRKIKNPEQIIAELGEYLTPKACSFVEVQNAGKWHTISPEKFKGEPFEIALSSKILGEVIFDLYYGNYGDGPKVCGPINEILPLTMLYLNMGKKQRGKVSKIWKTVAGHVYIPTANTYRMHEGGFSEEFYTSEACNDLIEMLKEVGEELERLSNKARSHTLQKRRDLLIDQIVKAGNIVSPVEAKFVPSDSGNRPAGGTNAPVDEDFYILPKGMRLYPGDSVPVVLRNQGRKQISFSRATWQADDKIVSVSGVIGGTATVKAIKEGSTQIVIKGEFGQHIIKVLVSKIPIGPFVSGPNYIKPGNSYNYELKRYDRDNLIWEIIDNPKSVHINHGTGNKREVSLDVSGLCIDCTFDLLVKNKSTKEIIAQKKIHINENGAMNHVPIIRIGKKDYILKKDFFFPETIAQVDYAFNDSEIPEIVVNTLHPRIKDLTAFFAADPMLAAIANAAIIDQVSEGLVKREDASRLVEEFVLTIKDKITEELAKDKERK